MPPIPPELAAVTLTRHPAPVADAMRALLAADSVHEQRDRVVECFRAAVRVTAIVALAVRLQPPAEVVRDGELAALLAALARRGLTDGQWVAVLRCAVAGLAERTKREDHADVAARSLCSLLRGPGRRRFARATDELLQMRRKETVAHGPTGDHAEVCALLERRVPALCTLLSSLTPLWTAISIAVPLDPIRGRQRALSLAGETPRQHRWQRIELASAAVPYTPVLIGDGDRPLLRLEPWARVVPRVDGGVDALWCIEGNGEHVWLPGAEVRRFEGQERFAVPTEAPAIAPVRRARIRWIATGAVAAVTAVLIVAGPRIGARAPPVELGAAAVPVLAAPVAAPEPPAGVARVRAFEASRRAASELLLSGHRAWIRALAVSADGAAAVSGDGDGALRVWSPADGTQQPIPGHDGAVLRVAFSPDASWIGSSGADGIVRLWSRTRAEGHVMRGHEGWVEALAFSADGQWVASGGRDRSVRLWRLESGGPRLERVLRGHRGAVISVDFSPDARLVVSASADATVRLWDRRSGRAQLLRGPRAALVAVGFDAAGAVVAASRDGELWRWSLATLRGRLVGTHGAELTAMAIGSQGAVLVGGTDGRVRRWLGGDAIELGARASPVTALVPTATGAIAGHADGAIVLYAVGAGRGDQLLTGHASAVGALAVSAAGILSGSTTGELRLWRQPAGDVGLRRGDAAIAGLIALGTGEVLAAGADGLARLRRGGAQAPPGGAVAVTAVAGGGELIVTGDADGRVRATRGAAPLLERRVSGAITWVGISPDAAVTAALTADGRLHLFDSDGSRLARRCGPDEPLVAAALGPGNGLTVATWDGAVRVCDAQGAVVRALEAGGVVRDLTWSRGGAALAAAGADGDVRVWRDDDAEPVRLRGHDDEVTRALFTAAGELVTSSRDGTVRLWDVASGTTAVLRGHTRGVTALALCDGTIVSGDAGGTVIFWRDRVPST